MTTPLTVAFPTPTYSPIKVIAKLLTQILGSEEEESLCDLASETGYSPTELDSRYVPDFEDSIDQKEPY